MGEHPQQGKQKTNLPRGLQHRLHSHESTRNKGNRNSCLEVQKIDFTKKESTVRNKSASRSKTTTLPAREHPPEGKQRETKDKKESLDTEGQKAKHTIPFSTKTKTSNKV